MTHEPTTYDTVAYPEFVHRSVHPERMAVAARLAGLDPVPLAEARVLEIGGGSSLGLIAFAATHPGSTCRGFDLAPSAIARGQALAGDDLPNLTLEVGDIMTAREHYAAGSFDYVIAHGVYAWVPAPVREALMALIGHVLSARGVAFVSYNAMPGGHVRMILREATLHAIEGIEGPAERTQAAAAYLKSYAEPVPNDDPLLVALRVHAAKTIDKSPAVLFHDELGECFAPQSLTEVVRAAEAQGLRFLTDAGRTRGFDGFLTEGDDGGDDPHEHVLRVAQARDYREMCFFRATLLVRNTAGVDRRLDAARIADMWLTAEFTALADGQFQRDGDRMTVTDPQLALALAGLSAIRPGRRRVSDLAATASQREAVLALYPDWLANFHLAPAPFVMTPGERPETGKLIRGMLARGEPRVVSLDSVYMVIEQPALRALLIAADGTRSLEELKAMDHGIPADEIEDVLNAAAGKCLLVA